MYMLSLLVLLVLTRADTNVGFHFHTDRLGTISLIAFSD